MVLRLKSWESRSSPNLIRTLICSLSMNVSFEAVLWGSFLVFWNMLEFNFVIVCLIGLTCFCFLRFGWTLINLINEIKFREKLGQLPSLSSAFQQESLESKRLATAGKWVFVSIATLMVYIALSFMNLWWRSLGISLRKTLSRLRAIGPRPSPAWVSAKLIKSSFTP